MTRPRVSRTRPTGSAESQLAALCLAEQAGRQSGLDGMQLQLGDLALQAQEEAPVRRRGVVDAIAVADEAMAVAAQVEQLIPVGAIA